MIIGITGGIGSGKSTIARALAARGYAIYDCDKEAKRIIAEDQEVQQHIIALFGKEAFVNGVYNTAYVASRVFAEPELLKQLNGIVHPAVKADIERSDFSIQSSFSSNRRSCMKQAWTGYAIGLFWWKRRRKCESHERSKETTTAKRQKRISIRYAPAYRRKRQSAISNQPSAISHQLSAISYQHSAIYW